MCYFVLFWVNLSRKMATTSAVSRKKLSLQSWNKTSSIFSTLEEPHRPRVPPMMRTLSIKEIKAPSPKVERKLTLIIFPSYNVLFCVILG